MRRRALSASVICTALVAAGVALPPAAGASSGADWMVRKYTALSDTVLRVNVNISMSADPNRPTAYGASFGLTGPGADRRYNGTWVIPMSGKTSTDVAFALSGNGARHRLAWPIEFKLGRSSAYLAYHIEQPMKKGQTLALAAFVPGGRIDHRPSANKTWTMPWQPIRVTERAGTGSVSFGTARVSHGGAGVEAAHLGAGAITRSTNASRGLIGAHNIFCECVGQWEGPGGKNGTWASSADLPIFLACWCAVPPVGDYMFEGGPGRWSWTWAGAAGLIQTTFAPLSGLGSPVVTAYAPVGDDWKLFTRK